VVNFWWHELTKKKTPHGFFLIPFLCVFLQRKYREEHFPSAQTDTNFGDGGSSSRTPSRSKKRKAKAVISSSSPDGGGGGDGGGGPSGKAQMEKLVAAWRELSEEQKVPFVAEATACKTK
jgi:hypothetical protein